MNHKVKSKSKSFKYTDFMGVLFLIHPFWIITYKQPISIIFYLCILFSLLFFTINLFGITGYYVKANNNSIVFYKSFIPQSFKYKDIFDIEKDNSKIKFIFSNGKFINLEFNDVSKKDRNRLNDLYCDIHNIVQRNTLKV